MLKAIKIVGLILGLLPVAFGALPASADPKKMLIEKDRGAYRYDDSAGRMCFISSVPTESKGKYDPNNRGETRVFVSHGPDKAERNVVQVVAGYRYKPQSDVTMTIDGKKFTLFTIEDRAFASSEEDDLRMIAAMKRGSSMTIIGTSSRGTKTTDKYSLSGFTKTKSVIDKTCKCACPPPIWWQRQRLVGSIYSAYHARPWKPKLPHLVCRNFVPDSSGAGYGGTA